MSRVYNWNGQPVTEAEFGRLVADLMFDRGWTLTPPRKA